ncbi:uncharacterized protein LOC134181759 [Corticium candelabrum]|uniref:uncharacterized protein LOC134181759 n=1 Tax=Corticium candelabrum TaxID=121492 RepID=UPI002E25B751|nr:uncharacterized protein LOC134181759 [Corticium candelabrum]
MDNLRELLEEHLPNSFDEFYERGCTFSDCIWSYRRTEQANIKNSYYKQVKAYRNSLKTALSTKKSQQSSDIQPHKTAEAQKPGFDVDLYLTILTPITAQCVKTKIGWKKNGFCVAKNDNSFVELSGNYLGKIQRSYQLTVHVFPVLIQNPDSIHFEPFVKYAQQAAFWRQVYGIPDPDVNWRKDGMQIEKTSTYFTKGSQWLLISEVTLADLGNYSCYVNNSLGHVESDLATLSASNATDRYFRFWRIYTTLTPILHQRAYIYIYCFSCFDLGTFKIYKNGIYLNTSADERIYFYSSYSRFRFIMSYVTEVDFGIYEILFVDRGISWFTVIDVQVPPMTSVTTIGDVYIESLEARLMGIYVQRHRCRSALVTADPIASAMRWGAAVQRRTYNVLGPNSLWHIDSHHSLIRWRLVVHGGIDGYSRMVVYLTCSDNNRADTVLEAFNEATRL